jgi:DNA excision repair protein ERCC-2
MTKLPKDVEKFFPYSGARPHQAELIETIFNALKNKLSVLVEGSNGLGKTVSALCACLPIALEHDLKIVYVARTHRQHERVVEELRAISKKQPVSGISMRGRREMCLNEKARQEDIDAKSFMEACDLLKSTGRCPFYRKIEDETYEYIELRQAITLKPYKASEVRLVCRKKHICPYELLKASLTDVDVVAFSYLYVFDPMIRATLLKTLDRELKNVILVVDEAHNLPETAAEIASGSLSFYAMKQAELEARKFGYDDAEVFFRLLREETLKTAVSASKEILVAPCIVTDVLHEKLKVDDAQSFFERIHSYGIAVKRALLSQGKHPRSYLHGAGSFLLRWLETSSDDSFARLVSKQVDLENAEVFKLELVALDPSGITYPVFSSTYSNVVMSGTLQPLDAYAKITMLPENTIRSVAPSPFPRDHVLAVVCLGVTTSMENRTPTMYNALVTKIYEVVENTPANTGVFAASFDVLNALVKAGLERILTKPLFLEQRGMSSRANEKLVENFKAQARRGGGVFLGVQGGRTSEGVDFPGDQMNAVIVVGVPYAEPTPRVNAQVNYYESRFPGFGREYGYVLQAMKRAFQAAGRPLRTPDDRAAIVFLDYRFATRYCRGFMPEWIRCRMKTLPDENGLLAQTVRAFFASG